MAPVIQRALPEQRKATAAPTSQPEPSTRRMERFFRASRRSGVMPPAWTIGVKTIPGQTQFTRIASLA